jgi:Tol biopolymer transport system component
LKRLRLAAAGFALAGCLLAAACGGGGGHSRLDLLFVSSRDGGSYTIWGMNADGSRQQRLTHDTGDASSPSGLFYEVDPAWSPDGRRIAFSSKRSGRSEIYAVRADGTGTRRLTSGPGEQTEPTWSPDGRRIAFAAGPVEHIEVMRTDGTRAHRVTGDNGEIEPAWSPAGGWIAYVRKSSVLPIREIWVVHPDGTGKRQLTSLGASASRPAWSPDGRRIAFADDDRGTFGIYTIGIDGKGLRRVTSSPADAFEPVWSPDGKLLAFAREGAIYTVTLGDKLTRLTSGNDNDSSPVWRPR